MNSQGPKHFGKELQEWAYHCGGQWEKEVSRADYYLEEGITTQEQGRTSEETVSLNPGDMDMSRGGHVYEG